MLRFVTNSFLERDKNSVMFLRHAKNTEEKDLH